MAAKTILKALFHYYIQRESHNRPFRLQLTDFHTSNIFVDKDWNITCLIDHEWVCVLPAEILSVPYWLTGCSINEITEDSLSEFDIVYQEFMDIFKEEEVRITLTDLPLLISIMYNNWKSGAVWFWYYIISVNAVFTLVEDHIAPKFHPLSTTAEGILLQYWYQSSRQVTQRKVTDREEYIKQLQALFSKEAGLFTEAGLNIYYWLPKPTSSPSPSLFLCLVALSIPAPSLPFLSLLSPSVLFPAHFWYFVRMRS
jgi:hypothetical protein